uniref:G-protein coupled receptors family 1 profile domain-containing protein n=1 Tax=Oncorhynchus mykiss TaxID=8022 RepID=A0A8C7TLJ6_ONCMY
LNMIVIVQPMNAIFIYIICLLTFFKKDTFRSNTRFIFFAHTLLSNCLYLIMTNNLLLLTYFRVTIPAAVCVVFCVLLSELTFATSLTLTAMNLESYVSICMPLRHGELCTQSHSLHLLNPQYQRHAAHHNCLHLLCLSPSGLLHYKLCSADMFISHKWQRHLRSVIGQFYFLVISITIVFTHVRIIAVAKDLFLCLIQLWCLFMEAPILSIHLKFPLVYGSLFSHYDLWVVVFCCVSAPARTVSVILFVISVSIK